MKRGKPVYDARARADRETVRRTPTRETPDARVRLAWLPIEKERLQAFLDTVTPRLCERVAESLRNGWRLEDLGAVVLGPDAAQVLEMGDEADPDGVVVVVGPFDTACAIADAQAPGSFDRRRAAPGHLRTVVMYEQRTAFPEVRVVPPHPHDARRTEVAEGREPAAAPGPSTDRVSDLPAPRTTIPGVLRDLIGRAWPVIRDQTQELARRGQARHALAAMVVAADHAAARSPRLRALAETAGGILPDGALVCVGPRSRVQTAAVLIDPRLADRMDRPVPPGEMWIFLAAASHSLVVPMGWPEGRPFGQV